MLVSLCKDWFSCVINTRVKRGMGLEEIGKEAYFLS